VYLRTEAVFEAQKLRQSTTLLFVYIHHQC
jgi:hypothetical protein